MVVYDDDEDDKEKIKKMIPETYYENFEGEPMALAFSHYGKMAVEELRMYLNRTTRVFTKGCEADKGLRLIYQNFSPYLYPFSVEYSILVGELKK